MANETKVVYRNSFPFLSILTLIFITLKLTGYITWSWWWVLSPIWISFLLVIAILIVTGIIFLVIGLAIYSGSNKIEEY